MTGPYGITAHRSAASIFGAARAPLKSDGQIRTFASHAEACTEAERLNAGNRSGNVWYTVRDRAANGDE